MDDSFLAIPLVALIFVGMPWVILHYITKWKTAASLTGEDEALLDQLHDTARRLDERLATIERIIAADNPDFRPSRSTAVPSILRTTDEPSLDRRN
ncbi:envelope stress response membrane protein PspB [soil metagenome]